MRPRIMDWDCETFSRVDLLKRGTSVYARDRSTRVELIAYSFDGDTRDIRQWDFFSGEPMPREFLDAMQDDRIIKRAFNCVFEQNITRHVLKLDVDFGEWEDPQMHARALGFPGALDAVAPAVGLDERYWKMEGGKTLVRFFSQPRKPTKKDFRTRNRPGDSAKIDEKWEEYKRYNRQDVVAQIMVARRLSAYPMLKRDIEAWRRDRAVNERGVPINVAAVQNAQTLVDAYTDDALEELRDITGLDNPNSGAQLLPWLKERGYPFDDLKAGHVKRAHEDAAKEGSNTSQVARPLELRLMISKAAFKKYDAYANAVCPDGMLRNQFIMFGAGRTGRWSGTQVQLQNLYRPHPRFEKAEMQEELAHTIEVMGPRAFKLWWGDTTEALASGVRGVIAAPEGHVYVDSDLNAIENRVLGYAADEEKILRVFALNRCPYVDFATYMFKEEYDVLWAEYKAGKKQKRQTSKPAVLGCLAEGTRVLTDRGWIAIEKVRGADLVHDGVGFVRHGGLLMQGVKRCVRVAGVGMTPDHEVMLEEGVWLAAGRFDAHSLRRALATADGQLSDTSGMSRRAARYTRFGATAAASLKNSVVAFCRMFGMDVVFASSDVGGALSPSPERGSTSSSRIATTRSRVAAPNILTTAVGESSAGSLRSMLLSAMRGLSSALRQSISSLIGSITTATMRGGTFVSQIARSTTPTGVTVTASSIAGATTALRSSADCSLQHIATSRPLHGKQRGGSAQIKSSAIRLTVEEHMTFDIAEAGPNHRFVILSEEGPLIVHNCGYQLSAGKEYENEQTGEIEATGLLGYARMMGVPMTLEEATESIKIWRGTYTRVVDFWRDLDEAAKSVITTGRRCDVGPFEFRHEDDFMTIRLPSGRKLYYHRPRLLIDRRKVEEERKRALEEDRMPRPVRKSIAYDGVDNKSKSTSWGTIFTYGGKTCLSAGTLVLTERGWAPIIEVGSSRVWDGVEWVSHDGVVCNGVKETIHLDGVGMTHDHEVLTVEGWRSASSCEGLDRAEVALPDCVEIRGFGWTEITLDDPLRLRRESRSRSEPVFDIINAGRRNRFVVAGATGPLIVHNCENLVQAVAREVIDECMARAERRGLDIRAHVHDQITCLAHERDAEKHARILTECMSEPMTWAPKLPLKAEATIHKIWIKD